MTVLSLSEITFPMDLIVHEQGQILGQAVVQREARSQDVTGTCVVVDHWIEQWQASGTLDEKTNTLTIKLGFDASARQGNVTCPRIPFTSPHSTPGFRSDAFRTPLDHFTLPVTEGATQHFELPMGPAKHSVDVTLLTGQGGAAAK